MTVPRDLVLEVVPGEHPQLKMHFGVPDDAAGRVLFRGDGGRIGDLDGSTDPDQDVTLVRAAFDDAAHRVGLPAVVFSTVGDYVQVLRLLGHLLPARSARTPGAAAVARGSDDLPEPLLRPEPPGRDGDERGLYCRGCVALLGIRNCPGCEQF